LGSQGGEERQYRYHWSHKGAEKNKARKIEIVEASRSESTFPKREKGKRRNSLSELYLGKKKRRREKGRPEDEGIEPRGCAGRESLSASKKKEAGNTLLEPLDD